MLRAPAAIPTATAWAAPQAAFGGPARVAMLDALLPQLRAPSVNLIHHFDRELIFGCETYDAIGSRWVKSRILKNRGAPPRPAPRLPHPPPVPTHAPSRLLRPQCSSDADSAPTGSASSTTTPGTYRTSLTRCAAAPPSRRRKVGSASRMRKPCASGSGGAWRPSTAGPRQPPAAAASRPAASRPATTRRPGHRAEAPGTARDVSDRPAAAAGAAAARRRDTARRA